MAKRNVGTAMVRRAAAEAELEARLASLRGKAPGVLSRAERRALKARQVRLDLGDARGE